MTSLIVIIISSIIIIGIAIFYFKATPEQRLKMLPSAGIDEITPSEQQAINDGELKVEPVKEDKRLIFALIAVFIFNIFSNFYLNQALTDCGLILGLFSSYWTIIILNIGLLIMLFIGLSTIYQSYQTALQTGLLAQKNRKSRKFRFFKRATPQQIKKEYAARIIYLLIFLVGITWQNNRMIDSSLKKVEMQSYSKINLQTYFLASAKLQQQCLANKTTP